MTDLFLPAGSAASQGVTALSAGWVYSGLQILRMEPAEARTIATETTEIGVLPLSGGAIVEIDDRSFELRGRESPFVGVSDFAYAPVDSELRITASRPSEIALCTAEATRRIEPYYAAAEDVAIEVRGGGIGTRQINNFLSADVRDADKLICVEVLTPSGNWSSYPPHKHDEFTADEVELEEIYYFRFSDPRGAGLFSLYTPSRDIDITETVRDGDVVLVPRGYHGPSAPAPGYHMYFLNVMAGPSVERVWKFTDDPDHHWMRAEFDALEPDPRLPMATAAPQV